VSDGTDLQLIAAAQQRALELDNGQPTAIVYETTKGWRYGIEGRASHGAGHPMCSEGFFTAVAELTRSGERSLPACEASGAGCAGGADGEVVEDCYWRALQLVREAVAERAGVAQALGERLHRARARLQAAGRAPRQGAPNLEALYAGLEAKVATRPPELEVEVGGSTTLRGELGKGLDHLNRASNGAILVAAADLLGSTSVRLANAGFPDGYYHAADNPESRLLSIGGICEDGMCGILAGAATYGRHVGAGSSYGAFVAALGHIPSRLHAIGQQARQVIRKAPFETFLLICAHAGLKTGEDGPTHADPQALQLLQENFPAGTMITLTPWDPQEVWPLLAAALSKRPAVVAPFVTRPSEPVLDRAALGLPAAEAAAQGVYALRTAKGQGDGSVVLQGSGVAYVFVQEVLPRLEERGVDLNAYYVASAELFDMLPEAERAAIFPSARADEAMAITGFTLSTMYRWVRSDLGRRRSLHPYAKGHYLGSGQGQQVIAEAGLDGDSQVDAIVSYVEARRKQH